VTGPRSRVATFREDPASEWLEFGSDVFDYHEWTLTATGLEDLVTTYGHPTKFLGDGGDTGGEFFLKKHSYEEWTNIPLDLLHSSGPYRFRGPQYARLDNVAPHQFPELHPSDILDLNSFGSTAIARVLPTNPVANLAQFIGELHEGVPRLVGADFFKGRARAARKAGSEYLNVEFGWKPLVSDVRKLAHAVKDRDAILAQYVKNSGKLIRRRFKAPPIVTVDIDHQSGQIPVPTLVTPLYVDYLGDMIITTTETIERWFSGAFTYYIAPTILGGSQRRGWLQKANHLLGIRLTPEVLWNLTPWSWAADWFGNAGDVYHNLSAFHADGLTMAYGYVMERKTLRRNYNLTGIRYKSFPDPVSFEQTLVTTTKKRVQATPYGFGLNPVIDFSDRQKAIVAALGLSRHK
jgi:hypothetical protein